MIIGTILTFRCSKSRPLEASFTAAVPTRRSPLSELPFMPHSVIRATNDRIGLDKKARGRAKWRGP